MLLINKHKSGDWCSWSTYIDDVVYSLYLSDMVNKNVDSWHKDGTMTLPQPQINLIRDEDGKYKHYYDIVISMIRKEKIDKIIKK